MFSSKLARAVLLKVLEYSKNYAPLNMRNTPKRHVFRSQPRKRIYLGPVILGPQPTTWIKKHRSFASREWFESQVRYGDWIVERGKTDCYLVYVEVVERIEPIKVLIKLKRESTHVLVYHAHVI